LIGSLWSQLLVIAVLVAATFGASQFGYRWGLRKSERETGDAAQLGTIQGAVLGLLGLLLGFSFAGASGRFFDRLDLITQEANAIGTAYLRAELLPAPHASHLQQALREYTRYRVEFFETGTEQDEPKLVADMVQQHNSLWSAARDGVLEAPQFAVAVLPPVNEVLDLHALRLAAAHRHLPLPIIALLISAAAIGLLSVGFGCGLSGKRPRLMTMCLSTLVATVLWVTIDFEFPKQGLIQLNQQPLLNLLNGFEVPGQK